MCPTSFTRLYTRGAILVLLALVLGGCMSEHSVTTRPEYAFPQNLEPLCGRALALNLDNTGVFFTSNQYQGRGGNVLLSAQFLEEKPEYHRLYRRVKLDFSQDNTFLITTFDEQGASTARPFPPERIHCGPDGELVLSFPSSNYYFWASMGTKGKTLALWTDRQGGLVVQNRWTDNMVGIIGGTTSGDAWASFQPVTSPSRTEDQPSADSVAVGHTIPEEGCPILAGEYLPEARVIQPDGSLDTRTAIDQFFREELIGPHPVNQEKPTVDIFAVTQTTGAGLEFSLFNQGELLATRKVEAEQLTCEENRWQVKGNKQVASAWLLMVASGGVSWENLSLWRDGNGDLLVEGVFKRRNAIFLIPLGDTQNLFMAFPQRPPAMKY